MNMKKFFVLYAVFLERMILQISAISRTAPKGTAVFATTGAGNIGDQALLESAVSQISGQIDVICEIDNAFTGAITSDPRVNFVVLPQLTYGRGFAHLCDLVRLGRVIARSRRAYIVGADVMDGGYNRRLSLVRWNFGHVASTKRRHVSVLGCSWNEAPDPIVRRSAVSASKRDLQVFARDPASYRRLRSAGVPALQAADIVFLLPRNPADLSTDRRTPGRVLLNVSGLIAPGGELDADYRRVVDYLSSCGLRTTIVPHVIRADNDDRASAHRAIGDRQPDTMVDFVDDLLGPEEIREMAINSDFVVTGRMHLAILALSVGTPAFVLATQGKVEGLLEMFHSSHMLVEPTPGFSVALIEEISALRTDLAAAQLRVSDASTEVTRLASSNFAHESR